MEKTIAFLKDLSKNNHREWFQANKNRYDQSQEEMVSFADSLLAELMKIDVISTPSGKRALHRIYRDVRFKKDKTPYKTNRSGYFTRLGQERRGGYYFHISPKESFVLGGFFGPNAEDLLHIRNQIAQFSEPLREVIQSSKFKAFFGELRGDKVKTAPRGFPKDHVEIDLLRHKQFYLRHDFEKEEVLSPEFPKTMANAFGRMLPFFTVMTEYLTTDLNGEMLLR